MKPRSKTTLNLLQGLRVPADHIGVVWVNLHGQFIRLHRLVVVLHHEMDRRLSSVPFYELWIQLDALLAVTQCVIVRHQLRIRCRSVAVQRDVAWIPFDGFVVFLHCFWEQVFLEILVS